MEDHWGWNIICNISMNYKPRLISTLVKWNKHGDDLILNTDGSYMMSTRKSGAGGIVRRRNGSMIMAFANPIHFSTNNSSEAEAALFGILWCYDQGLANFRMQLDSMLTVQMIRGNINIPWNLIKVIAEIQHKVNERGIKVSHCYREGNSVADALAKHGTTLTHNVIFDNENQLPREVRGAYNTNKLDIPSFRFKVTKHSSWHFDPPR
ncbi:hypothetical protein P3S67_002225 [Capsicum chacoense]